MKALVLGCGSIGLRHIGHLRELGITNVEAVDPSPEACERARARYGITTHPDSQEPLYRKPDMVLVCTPATAHLEGALKALEAGAHVFIEKPLSIDLAGTERLLKKVRTDGRVVQVGYQLRYHPAMLAAKEILDSGRIGKALTAHAEFGLYLERWWPGRDYRQSYMADTRHGGGLLLDVSHEIDLILWFLGPVEEVFAHGAHLSGLEIKGLDAIKILMKTAGGASVSLHMDCLQPVYTRSLTLTGEGTGLKWDCPSGRADQSMGRLMVCDRSGEEFTPVPLQEGGRTAYLEELSDFISSIRSGKSPRVGAEQGVEVLRVVEAIQKSIETGVPVRLPA